MQRYTSGEQEATRTTL